MHTLFLMRHAKAQDWSSGSGDHSRQLTPAGRTAASLVGTTLRTRDIDLALVSSATRTRQTFECLGLDCRVEVTDDLYNCDSFALREAISQVDESVGSLLVVGHNPTIPAVAEDLTRADEDFGWFPTAAWAEIRIDETWAEVASLKDAALVGVTRR